MFTGNLTPKSNDKVVAMRFTGAFGQSDGFGSVLNVEINKAGHASLTLFYNPPSGATFWAVELDSEQRRALAVLLMTYEPKTFERYEAK